MPQVYPAEPYQSGSLNSRGHANHMLLRQFNFPDTFRDDEPLVSKFSDRLDHASFRSSLVRHTGGSEDWHVEAWLRRATHGRIFELIKDVVDADQAISWTGYRVTGSVAGNGQTIWTFELFARRPDSQTAIYTTEQSPNVLTGPRYAQSLDANSDPSHPLNLYDSLVAGTR